MIYQKFIALRDFIEDEEGHAREGLMECLKDEISELATQEIDIFVGLINQGLGEIY